MDLIPWLIYGPLRFHSTGKNGPNSSRVSFSAVLPCSAGRGKTSKKGDPLVISLSRKGYSAFIIDSRSHSRQFPRVQPLAPSDGSISKSRSAGDWSHHDSKSAWRHSYLARGVCIVIEMRGARGWIIKTAFIKRAVIVILYGFSNAKYKHYNIATLP